MKRFLILLLAAALCLGGCRRQLQSDLPGADTAPEGVDWQLWEDYTPATLVLEEETVDVLMALDAIHLAVYYDRQEQELLASLTIPLPLADVGYSREHLRIRDLDGDGWDDICVPDILENGDRILNWWLWDPEEDAYRYSQDLSVYQENISADASWQTGKTFIRAAMDTPDGSQDLLILVQEPEILVYLDTRQQQLWGSARIPEPLSEEAREHLAIYSYWDCRDLNGDGWGDLQLPCRWETAADGSVYQYAWCFLWDPQTQTYLYDTGLSEKPAA